MNEYDETTTDERTDEQIDDSLQANRFGQELADLEEDEHLALVEERLQSARQEFHDRSTDSLSDYEGRFSDDVAELWDTITGDWWP